MAKQFISDADMAKMEQSQPQTQKQFISDDEMAKLDSQDQPQEHGFGYRVAKSASGALPYLGGAFGGLVGTAAGIPGQIGGAALGYGMGKTAQNALLAAMGDEDAPKTREEIWSRAAKSIPEGATLEAGGLVANKVIGDVAAKGAGLLQRTLVKPKANYGEILAAGDKIGVKPTPGMLSDSPVYQKLENSLQQSPTVAGSLTRREVNPTYKGIQQTGEDLANVGSGDRFQAGQAIQGKLSDKMAKQAEISSKNFEELNQALPNIEAPKKSVIGTADLITKHPVLKYDAMGGIRGKAQNIADTLKTLTTANDINKLKTYVGKLNPGDANEAQFLKDTYKSLDNLVQTSIRRESQGLGVATGDPQAEKDAVGLLKSRLSANKKYKSTMEGLEQTGSALGANISRRDTPGIIARKVSDLRPEDVARRMVNPNDQETVNYFSSKHPEMFNIAAKSDIANAGQRATHKDGLSVPQFLNRFKNVPDNVQKKMFGADYERMQAMKTLSNASPNMVGPSGTQQAQEVAGLLNPITQAKRLGQYGIYKGAPELESTLSGVSKIAKGENLPGVGGKPGYLPGQLQGNLVEPIARDLSRDKKEYYKDEISDLRNRFPHLKDQSDDQIATTLSMISGGGGVGSVESKGLLGEERFLSSRLDNAIEKLRTSYENPAKASQAEINEAAKTLNQAGEHIKGGASRDILNKYDSLKSNLERQIQDSPSSKFAQDQGRKERRSRDAFPKSYELGEEQRPSNLVDLPKSENNPGLLGGDADVLSGKFDPMRNQKDYYSKQVKNQIDKFGEPVSRSDVLSSRTGENNSYWNKPQDFQESAANKYAFQKNMEKAQGGEFIKNPPDKYSVGEQVSKVAENSRTRAIKQIKDNDLALGEWRQKLANDPNPDPKEIEMFKNMVEQHQSTKRELDYKQSWKTKSNISPNNLTPAEVFDARQAFEMWGGRPTVKGKKGGLIEVERGGPYGGMQRASPGEENLNSGDQYYKDNPDAIQKEHEADLAEAMGHKPGGGLLVPQEQFLNKVSSQQPTADNEALQRALDIYAKNKGHEGLFEVKRAFDGLHSRANFGVVGVIGKKK